jgi:hypothetical protein
MELTTLLIIMIIFIIFFSISFMIQDIKYRVSYYMILALLFLATLNIYLSIVYYIQLRNTQGVQGKMGNKGPTGVQGNPGICSFSETCGIDNVKARTNIIGIANQMYGINTTCLDTPTLVNCDNNQDTLDQAIPINAQINMLQQIAHDTSMAEADFMSKVKVCIQDSNSCMDPTDF